MFIPKPGQDDYSVAKSFRQISLTSFLFKTLEQLVLWRLEDTTLKEHPLHEQQHTFRKGLSSEVALSRSVNHIEQAIHKIQLALGLFLDIELGGFLTT